jgi:PAS domain S-box-containing protein
MGLVAPDGSWLRFNDRLCELLRADRAAIAARLPRDLIHPEDRPAAVAATARLLSGEVGSVDAERRYLRADGRLLLARVTTSVVRRPDGTPDALLTQLVAVRGGRAGLGDRDPVTGAATLEVLVRHVALAQQRARRSSRTLVLLSVEMLPPSAPDASRRDARLLSCLAQRMTGVVRGSDVVGRTGPARLTVACEGLRDDAETALVASRLRAALAEPVDVDGRVSTVDVQLQVTVAGADERARELVLRPGWPAAGLEPGTGRRSRRHAGSSL